MLLQYFGDFSLSAGCGNQCDNCMNRTNREWSYIENGQELGPPRQPPWMAIPEGQEGAGTTRTRVVAHGQASAAQKRPSSTAADNTGFQTAASLLQSSAGASKRQASGKLGKRAGFQAASGLLASAVGNKSAKLGVARQATTVQGHVPQLKATVPLNIAHGNTSTAARAIGSDAVHNAPGGRNPFMRPSSTGVFGDERLEPNTVAMMAPPQRSAAASAAAAAAIMRAGTGAQVGTSGSAPCSAGSVPRKPVISARAMAMQAASIRLRRQQQALVQEEVAAVQAGRGAGAGVLVVDDN